MKPLLKTLASLELTIGCLALSMVLVFFGTIDQVHLGIHGAVEKYFYTLFVTHPIDSLGLSMPYMPGGYLLGGALMLNLISALIIRFRFSLRKLGVWMVHLGFILLLLGEFITSLFQQEASLTLDEGSSSDFKESYRDSELAIIDTTGEETDRVYAIPHLMLERGQQIVVDELPFNVAIDDFMANAQLFRRNDSLPEAAELATRGEGRQMFAREIPETGKMDERNLPAVLVTLFSKDLDESGKPQNLGTWLAHEIIGPQIFSYEGRNYRLKLRRQREVIPYVITLNDFSHDRYLGTNIPKNFSSQITVRDKRSGASQEFLVYMNNPLRYDDLTFYQQGFMNEDKTSILQVVRNPGRHLPYISCTIMTLGLIYQFGFGLYRFSEKRKKAAA